MNANGIALADPPFKHFAFKRFYEAACCTVA